MSNSGYNTSKPIRFSAHALGYAARRGFSAADVEDAIRTGTWSLADEGRYQSRKNFPYNAEWNGKTYATRQVKPVFVETDTEIVVVTVYTFYF